MNASKERRFNTTRNLQMEGGMPEPDENAFETALAFGATALTLMGGVYWCSTKVCGRPDPPRVHAVPLGTPVGALPMSTVVVDENNYSP